MMQAISTMGTAVLPTKGPEFLADDVQHLLSTALLEAGEQMRQGLLVLADRDDSRGGRRC
jgi:hypothetical protein